MRLFRLGFLAFMLLRLSAAQPSAQQASDAELQKLLGTPAAAPTDKFGADPSAMGVANTFNPAVSLTGLMLGVRPNKGPTQFGLSEFEVQFSSVVDPYFRADVTITFPGPVEAPLPGAEEEGGEDEGPSIEQALISSTALPQVGLRFGQFLLPFGKHNQFHLHAFPFITPPLVNGNLLGPEGLNQFALEVTPLLPLPYFSELNIVVFQGDSEPLFLFGEAEQQVYVFDPDTGTPLQETVAETLPADNSAKTLLHWKNFFDVSDASSMEVGLSYLTGENNAGAETATTARGVDLTFKRKPPTGRGGSAWVFQTEWIGLTRETETVDLESSGWYASAQFRIATAYWVQGRMGAVTLQAPAEDTFEETGLSHTDILLGWVPTEFSAFRLQFSQAKTEGGDTETTVLLQYNFAIGSHPAHSY